jgi:hypothetical protein
MRQNEISTPLLGKNPPPGFKGWRIIESEILKKVIILVNKSKIISKILKFLNFLPFVENL